MIEEIKGNIFTIPLDGMVHQCNAFHTMGGGLAKIVKDEYPTAYLVDILTKYGDIKKIGTFSFSMCTHNVYHSPFIIFNCYSQYNYGTNKVQTDYEAVKSVLKRVKIFIKGTLEDKPNDKKFTLGIPHGYGCGLAGGDWNTVSSIIEEIFGTDKTILVKICKLQ